MYNMADIWLKSNQGDVLRSDAQAILCVSPIISECLKDVGTNSPVQPIVVSAPTLILEKAIEWCYKHRKGQSPFLADGTLTPWNAAFIFDRIDRETRFGLLLTSHLLSIESLYELCCKAIGTQMMLKCDEGEIRNYLDIGIANDLTLKEQKEIASKNSWCKCRSLSQLKGKKPSLLANMNNEMFCKILSYVSDVPKKMSWEIYGRKFRDCLRMSESWKFNDTVQIDLRYYSSTYQLEKVSLMIDRFPIRRLIFTVGAPNDPPVPPEFFEELAVLLGKKEEKISQLKSLIIDPKIPGAVYDTIFWVICRSKDVLEEIEIPLGQFGKDQDESTKKAFGLLPNLSKISVKNFCDTTFIAEIIKGKSVEELILDNSSLIAAELSTLCSVIKEKKLKSLRLGFVPQLDFETFVQIVISQFPLAFKSLERLEMGLKNLPKITSLAMIKSLKYIDLDIKTSYLDVKKVCQFVSDLIGLFDRRSTKFEGHLRIYKQIENVNKLKDVNNFENVLKLSKPDMSTICFDQGNATVYVHLSMN